MNDREWLAKIVATANKFRSTPIVDDDFPDIRDEFDATLREATSYLNKRTVMECSRCHRTTEDEYKGKYCECKERVNFQLY
jgi:hypothetical protein